MSHSHDSSHAAPTRRDLLRGIAGSALAVSASSLVLPATAGAAQATLPRETLISLWEHAAKVDIAPVVKQVGFNTIWTHDKPYDGKMKLEDTLMYRHMQVPGVKYVIPKIERGIWGWNYDQSIRHAEWIAELSQSHPQIIGLYLNDFYDDVKRGGHTLKEFQQMIARVRAINPKLPIWVPVYPVRESNDPFDFDYDVVIFSIHFEPFDRKQLPHAEEHLVKMEEKFAGKPILTGFYIKSGPDGTKSVELTEQEFRFLLSMYVRHINAGKTIGLRIFRAQDFLDNPQWGKWAVEEISKLKKA